MGTEAVQSLVPWMAGLDPLSAAEVVDFLREENRMLREKLDGRRLRCRVKGPTDASGMYDPPNSKVRGAMRDFFISFNKADTEWAEWIAWHLEEAGYTTLNMAWDFGLGANFGAEMHRAASETERTIVVLSPDFLKSEYCQPEWVAAFVADPTGRKRKLLPIQVRECDPPGLLKPLVKLDISKKDEAEAPQALIRAIEQALKIAKGDRAKPSQPPPFPNRSRPVAGGQAQPASPRPAFGEPDLGELRGSRPPIVVALESEDQPIVDTDLLRIERHLTVTLPFSAIEELAAISRSGAELAGPAAGRRAWTVLTRAQPRLASLFQGVKAAGDRPQPIAWTGADDVLWNLHRAILVARSTDAESDIVSVGAGDHFFNPLPRDGMARNLPPRWKGEPQAASLALDPQSNRLAPVGSAAAEIVLLADGARPKPDGLAALAEALASDPDGHCRVVVGLGDGDVVPDLLQKLLAHAPCLSLGGPGVRTATLVDALAAALPRWGGALAAPCILAAFRRALIRQAIAAGDNSLLVEALLWTTWSWIGRPIFAGKLAEIAPAPTTYPHVLDLRSVASKEWYYDRGAGIPGPYQAEVLARTGVNRQARFHLYLSGAGGTGKSCFLKSVHDRLEKRADVLPVWYRVDAPGSEWTLVEKRIKDEAIVALRTKRPDAAQLIPDRDLELSAFLSELAARLAKIDPPIGEVVVFIDQLERTFESGEEPDPSNLREISRSVMALLRDVNVGDGVRVFIASRKQYLPDFLRSSDEANASKLHFNVLQTINESNERREFVKRIREWCRTAQLIDEAFKIEPGAAELLASKVDGNPLNLMLALIQLFSQAVPARKIDETLLGEYKPWEKLFNFDLQLMAKDDIDWYFLLAMAAARTEIVRAKEIWWRLRLVNSRISRRVEELGPQGLLERLWLVGHLGRTIHARPDENDNAAFFEFFHANLRDYLLRDVMGTSNADIGVRGRSGGTPPAWRALDRLAAAAHEWEQTLQALPPEDLAVLMLNRDVVIEAASESEGADPEIFELLFLRDARGSRERLRRAARECIVFSALVHGDFGRWAFDKLFPSLDDKVKCCESWLRRSSSRESRLRILEYLVELQAPQTRRFLARLVLSPSVADLTAIWVEVADVLAEPLFAARYRDDVVFACIEQIAGGPAGAAELPRRLGEFVVASCEGNRGHIARLLIQCANRAAGLKDHRFKDVTAALRSERLLDQWLVAGREQSDPDMRSSREVEGRPPTRIQIAVGAKLAQPLSRLLRDNGRRHLAERLGVPLPEVEVVEAELSPELSNPAFTEYEAELRLAGQSVAVGCFPQDRCQTLRRHWKLDQIPPDALHILNDALGEMVLWIDEAQLAASEPVRRVWRANDAVLEWLAVHLRANVDLFFDFDLMIEFVREISTRVDTRRLFRNISLPALRHVIASSVREGVPLWKHRFSIVQELQRLVGGGTSLDVLVQKVREIEVVRVDICAGLLSPSGQLHVITIEPRLEEELVKALSSTQEGDVLEVSAARTRDMASSFHRSAARCLHAEEALPVLVTIPLLRRPLFDLLQPFDRRVHALSFSELSPRTRVALAGELTPGLDEKGHADELG